MKWTHLFILSLLYIIPADAQSDCQSFLPTTEGTRWEITNYTAKGKESGRILYELMDKTVSGSTVTFSVRNTTFDKKGDEIFSNNFDATCEGGTFQIDMSSRMDGGALQAYQDMDLEMESDVLEFPSMRAPAGTKLDDGNLEVKIKAGLVNINMNVLITDRRVEAREEITTPAGTFDCIVVSQNTSTKMLVNLETSSKEWYAENVGMVRSESYNKRGKLIGYSELTTMERK